MIETTATDYHEKQLQRALLQFNRPENADLVREALTKAGRTDLIGFGPECLVKPAGGRPAPHGAAPHGAAPHGGKPAPKKGAGDRQGGKNETKGGYAPKSGHAAPKGGKAAAPAKGNGRPTAKPASLSDAGRIFSVSSVERMMSGSIIMQSATLPAIAE